MQSELASHIGLRGRLFCRACWVSEVRGRSRKKAATADGSEGDDSSEGSDDEYGSGSQVDTGSEASVAGESPNPAAGGHEHSQPSATQPVFDSLLARVKAFVKVSFGDADQQILS